MGAKAKKAATKNLKKATAQFSASKDAASDFLVFYVLPFSPFDYTNRKANYVSDCGFDNPQTKQFLCLCTC